MSHVFVWQSKVLTLNPFDVLTNPLGERAKPIGVPNEVSVEDTAVLEQLKLINELDNEEKNILLKLIETFVSKKRFKDYLQQNIAAL